MFNVGDRVRIKMDAEVYAQGVAISEDEIGIVTMTEDDGACVDWDGVDGWLDMDMLERV